MADKTRRGPTMADALLIVAAVAAGLAVGRLTHYRFNFRISAFFLRNDLRHLIEKWADPILYCLSLATIVMAWLPGRTIEVRRSPGVIGAVTACLVVTTEVGLRLAQHGSFRSGYLYVDLILMTSGRIGAWALASAWIALLIAGSWCPNRGWPDRFGRVLGGLWICGELLDWVFIVFDS